MQRIGIYSGTFDPITLGHIDVILRARTLFDVLFVAVAAGHHKKTLFTQAERMALVAASLPQDGIKVVSMDGLIVDSCKQIGAQTIVRGVRNGTDVDYESQMAQMNRKLAHDIETIFMLPEPSVQCISSTLVREISRLGGDVSQMVSPAVAAALAKAQA